MLHVFSTNRVKLVAQKLKTTNKLGQREYGAGPSVNDLDMSSALFGSSKLNFSPGLKISP
jgi:hypothetical protein